MVVSCKKLTAFSVSNTHGFDALQIKKLIKFTANRITLMNFRRCKLSLLEIKSICTHFTLLKKINLTQAVINDVELTDDILILLATHCKLLTSLKVDAELMQFSDIAVIALVKSCKYLTDFEVNGPAQFGYDAICVIAETLGHQLVDFEVSKNQNITDECIVKLSEHCKKLYILSLQGCDQVTHVGIATAIEKVLGFADFAFFTINKTQITTEMENAYKISHPKVYMHLLVSLDRRRYVELVLIVFLIKSFCIICVLLCGG
jgi:hypothetical protein